MLIVQQVLEKRQSLSRRERQIVDILYQHGCASAADILAALIEKARKEGLAAAHPN